MKAKICVTIRFEITFIILASFLIILPAMPVGRIMSERHPVLTVLSTLECTGWTQVKLSLGYICISVTRNAFQGEGVLERQASVSPWERHS